MPARYPTSDKRSTNSEVCSGKVVTNLDGADEGAATWSSREKNMAFAHRGEKGPPSAIKKALKKNSGVTGMLINCVKLSLTVHTSSLIPNLKKMLSEMYFTPPAAPLTVTGSG